jgi:hypothetical protein
MPVSTMIVLAGVVAMFTVFALAWAQLQTRHPTVSAAPARAISSRKRRPF